MTEHDLTAVAKAIATNPTFDGADQDLVLALYIALADGERVSVASMARRLGRSVDSVRETIERCNVQFDADEIVGFGGLSRLPTPHAFHVRDRRLYTWCAWDPLFIAPILGDDASVESTCPVTGDQIRLVVGPDGPRDVSPPNAVLSMRVPDERATSHIVSNFCSFVLLFASAVAAKTWTAERPGTFVISIDDAFDLGRMLVFQRAGRNSSSAARLQAWQPSKTTSWPNSATSR
jgi:alkylmercury lyase